mgnify:CR=1 FL=1
MIQLKAMSEKTIRREVFEFDEEIGEWEADTWTRVTVSGELSGWVPHDAYGELPQDPRSYDAVEQKYQNSDYA